jgi:RND family efflux transporter MFP subunit
MSPNSTTTLEIEDLQAAVLHPRRTPYASTLIFVRVDDRRYGRELVRRLISFLRSAGVGARRQSLAAFALTFEGLSAPGGPEESLATFPVESREGMAARAEIVGDADESATEHWEAPIAGGSRSHGNPIQNGFAKGIRVGRSMVAWLAAVSVLICLLPCDGLAAEPLELKFDGTVVARQFMQVAPQVSGAVSRILFVPGQRVAQGEVLFELDADVFKIDVSAAQSELDEARARLNMAADEAGRQAQLMEHSATPVARAKQTAIEVQIARAVVARKESALARAELALSHTRIVAPISGTVGRPHVAPGAFVDAKADTVLAEIAQLDPILVACYVSYIDRERFFKQAGTSSVPELFRRVTVSVELPSGRAYEYSGMPEFESAEIDRTTDMLTVWAGFSNPDNELVPGLKVRVTAHVSE